MTYNQATLGQSQLLNKNAQPYKKSKFLFSIISEEIK